jgi:transcriptional regulator with XRE-family HTH domain
VKRNNIERRIQLAEFLKIKRAQLTPSDVGFTSGSRRRTPGLRREEVAELAGVGHVWYTWLEQGRTITPSAEVLGRLAGALRLNCDERIYLFRLARPQAGSIASDSSVSVPERIVEMIRSFEHKPAYVRNLRWDILASNEAHAKVFGDYSSVPIEHRNMLWLLFTEPKIRAMLINWEIVAQQVIARFRADLSKNPEDKRANELKNRLLKTSPDFARWWRQYRTTEILTHPIELVHPDAGQITLERVTLRTESEPNYNVIIYMPIDKRSIIRLKALCGHTLNIGGRSRRRASGVPQGAA